MSEAFAASVVIYCDGDQSAALTTLGALARQTLAGVEVLLAGDAPDEAALGDMVVRRLEGAPLSDPPSAGDRNAAIAAAVGPYVLELRAGDVPAPTMLEKCVWALGTRPGAAIALAGPVRDDTVENARAEALPLDRQGSTVLDLTPGAYVVRRKAWGQVQGFSPDAPFHVADADACLKILERGWTVTRVGEELVRLRAGAPADDGARDAWLCDRHPGAYRRADADRWRRGRWVRTRTAVPLAGRAADRVAAKLEFEQLSGAAALRRPLHSALRFLPQRLKGGWWDSVGLPRRTDIWDEVPPLTDLPEGSGLGPAIAPRPVADARTQVLVLHPYLIAGGAETVVLNLLTHIDRDSFATHLITTEAGPSRFRWMRNPMLKDFTAQTDSVFYLPAFLDDEYRLRFLVDFIQSRRIDVVLVSLSIFGYNALPQLRRECPDAAVIDLLHAEAPYVPMDHIRLAARHRELMDRRVVTTESVRSAQISKYGETPERVVVIPNGIDTAEAFDPVLHPAGVFRCSSGISDDAAIVLFFGRIAEEKQPMHIVEVAGRLRDRSDIVFAIVGDGAEKAALERTVAERCLSNVVICGPQKDIAPALADASLVFFPSKREGLPMSGIEAMAMGRPVVASRVQGWTDLVEDGVEGFLLDDGDFDGYAEAISRLVDDAGLAARMAAAGRRKAVDHYDVHLCVRQWERLFADPKGALR